MKTHFPSQGEIVRKWHVVDAADQVLGRVASKAAMLLMGKHKPTYTTFLDTGDHVIIVNAAKIRGHRVMSLLCGLFGSPSSPSQIV